MLAPNQGKFKQSDDASTAALRLQLQKELQNKKQCSYQPYECTQLTHDRYNYCLHHILSDKSAPFKQCAFLYTNGKRCYLPAPKADNKKEFRSNSSGYCNEHALKTHLQRSKAASKQPPPRTAEVLLHSLSHYVKRTRTRTTSVTSEDGGRSTTPDHPESKVTKSYDPFVDINAAEVNASCSDILDLCSESESDVEASTFSSVWQDAHADSSDNESIDSENGDPLKHANVYTAEEITSITKDKLVRLQSLYMEQFHHLHHILKERRRKYIHALKREKETCCSISNQLRDNPKEQRMYKKLKAYNRYHKRYGVDAILAKREHELRMKVTEGTVYKPHTFTKCAFTEGGVKCLEKALPVARHCRKHILEDSNQVLFRICGKLCADIECPTPVEAIFDESTCHLHRDIPILRSYAQLRKDSESDYDDKDNPDSGILPQNENVQTEYISQPKPEFNQHLPTFSNSNSDDIIETSEELLKTEIVDDIEMPLVLDLPVADFPDVAGCEIEDTIVEVGEFAENFENSSSIADSLEKSELVIEEELVEMEVCREEKIDEKMYEKTEKMYAEMEKVEEKVEETGKLQEKLEKVEETGKLEGKVEKLEGEVEKPEIMKDLGEINEICKVNNDLK